MAYKCLSLCRFRGFIAGFCKNFIQRFQKFKMRLQGKAKNLDLFRMRKKFRVQVERNFPTLSHERFSIVEPVVQFEKLLGNIIAFINAGYSYHTCGSPADRPLQRRNRRTQGCRGCTILAAWVGLACPELPCRKIHRAGKRGTLRWRCSPSFYYNSIIQIVGNNIELYVANMRFMVEQCSCPCD